MTEPYSKSFAVRWADLDPNRHMRNTAYLEYATEVRFSFLADSGFPPAEFERLNFGPVIFREEMRFLAEVKQGEHITVDYRLAAASPDARKFRLRHDIYRSDGGRAAEVRTDGGWMDLATRKLRPAPPALLDVFEKLVRTQDFEEL